MLKDYCKRLVICVCGLALFSLGSYFGVLAGSAGTNGWNTMALGLSNVTGMSFGTGVFVIGIAILIIDFLGKGKLGLGTLLNVLIIPMLSDFFLRVLTFIPDPPNVAVGIFYTLLGQMIIAFATVVYMSPGLGAGPRDTLMVILSKAFPKVPVGLIKFILEMFALVSGVLMGAAFGLGTVLVITLQASFFQFACYVCKFVPREVVNEDFADTWRKLRSLRSPSSGNGHVDHDQ